MSRILVVDDDPRICKLLVRYLTGEGYAVATAADGAEARQVLQAQPHDLVLLDLQLPGEDGLTIARELRATSDIAIIMITGKGDVFDKVVGLEVGADDYVTKPFHLREVLARIKSVLRRSAAPATAEREAAAPPCETVRFDRWRLELDTRRLLGPGGAEQPLTAAEFNLLTAFLRNPQRVLSRDQLLDMVAGRNWEPFDRSIDTQVRRLRRKIERAPERPELIKTVRGAGYVFAAKVEQVA